MAVVYFVLAGLVHQLTPRNVMVPGTLVGGLLVGLYAGLVLLATQVLRFHSMVAVAPR